MVRRTRVLHTVFFALQIFLTTAVAQFQNGNHHRGVYPDAVIQNSAEMEWRFRTDGAVRSTPAVTEKSIIFGSTDGTICSLDHSGSLQWKFSADASVSSSPVVSGSAVFFTSRNNTLYSLSEKKGTLNWKRSLGTRLPYEWGFDYYTGSITVENGTLFAGSADGHLFALRQKDGNELWRFKSGGVIRSTPAVDEENVYFGDMSGKLFAVNKKNGIRRWVFSTIGDTLNNENFGFDRKALLSSPTVYKGTVYVGSRDGFLYAVDRTTGKERWHVDYSVSWVISTAAVTKDILITGTSDGRFVHALSSETGKELWRFNTQATVWASPFISGNGKVVIPSNDGYLYCLELITGSEVWRVKVGPQIFSTPVPKNNSIYFGSDDGYLNAVRTKHSATTVDRSAKRAVFWMKEPPFQLFRSGMDVAVRDHFIKEGYEFYDETDVKDFLLKRIKYSDTASVTHLCDKLLPPRIDEGYTWIEYHQGIPPIRGQNGHAWDESRRVSVGQHGETDHRYRLPSCERIDRDTVSFQGSAVARWILFCLHHG
jgi:outer membrane protein assembly factor BamB